MTDPTARPAWCETPADEEGIEELDDDDGAHEIARGEDHTVVVPRGDPGSATNAFTHIGAWLDSFPTAAALDASEELHGSADVTDRLAHGATFRRRPARGDDLTDYDAHEFERWFERVVAIGLTDIVLLFNRGRNSGVNAIWTPADGFRRMRYLAQRIGAHRYPEGSSPRVHLLAFFTTDIGSIEANSAGLIDAGARVGTIASVMLDCEEWWLRRPRSERTRAAEAVHEHLVAAWPSAQRPPSGLGVTGLASSPPRELLEMMDYGVPQIYCSPRNMGDRPPSTPFTSADREGKISIARARHQNWYRTWNDAFGGRSGTRVVVAHTARGLYVPDADRLRLLVMAALGIGGSGSPALPAPDSLYYWSVAQIFHLDEPRYAEVQRLARLARTGGLTLANIDA